MKITNNMRPVQLKLPIELYKELKKLSIKKNYRNISVLVRVLITEALENENN